MLSISLSNRAMYAVISHLYLLEFCTVNSFTLKIFSTTLAWYNVLELKLCSKVGPSHSIHIIKQELSTASSVLPSPAQLLHLKSSVQSHHP